MRKYIKLGIGVLFTALFLYLSYKRVGSLELKAAMTYPINYLLVLISVIFFVLSQWFRALAWSRGLDREFQSLRVFKAVCVGNGTNMVMPFRLGEAARIAVLGNGKSRSYANAGVCILVERLTDIIILMTLAVGAVFFINFSESVLNKIEELRNFIMAAVVLAFLVSAGMIWVKRTGRNDFSWLRDNALIERAINIIQQIQVFKSPVNLLKSAGFLFISWSCVYLCTLAGILSVGLDVSKALSGALAVLILTNLAMLIPAAPGGIGIFQYACIYALGVLGVGGTAVAVLSVLLHIVQYAALLPLALYFVFTEKMFFKNKNLAMIDNDFQLSDDEEVDNGEGTKAGDAN